MAWIKSYQELEKHPKTLLLASIMGWTLDETIGKLHRFWWWAVDYAEDGDLRKYNNSIIGSSIGIHGVQADKFVEAMLEACWLDRAPYFRIHDWWDYIGKKLDQKYAHDPIRYRRVMKAYGKQSESSQKAVKRQSKDSEQEKRREEKKERDKELPPKSPQKGDGELASKPYPKPETPTDKVICAYKLIQGAQLDDRAWDKRNWARAKKTAISLLDCFSGSWEKTVDYMDWFVKDYKKKGLEFTIETMLNKFDEWRLQTHAKS